MNFLFVSLASASFFARSSRLWFVIAEILRALNDHERRAAIDALAGSDPRLAMQVVAELGVDMGAALLASRQPAEIVRLLQELADGGVVGHGGWSISRRFPLAATACLVASPHRQFASTWSWKERRLRLGSSVEERRLSAA